MHENSILLFEKYARPLFRSGMRILEVGPDGFPSTYQNMVTIADMAWDTLDIYDSPSLTYSRTDLYDFPIPNNHYDLVLSGQVIEHVARVWRWMAELARITKPGGLVITINPVSWPYHAAPIDCWRIFPEGMRALCTEAGLTVETSFWGSLEFPRCWRTVPGYSLKHQSKFRRICSPLLGLLGWRVEKAFDTITIARKPAN